MQPTDQISTDSEYSFSRRSNYGALYQRVTTFLVRGFWGFSTDGPKGTKLASQSEVSNLENALSAEEQIGQLEIPVDHVLRVGVLHLCEAKSTPLMS